MQAAVEKRDGGIITALDAFYASWKSNLQKRLNDLKSAWGMGDKKAREKAIKTAWRTYQENQKKARKAFNDSRKAMWKTFRNDAKACKQPTSDIEGEVVDQID